MQTQQFDNATLVLDAFSRFAAKSPHYVMLQKLQALSLRGIMNLE
jgi:hypothetical protein